MAAGKSNLRYLDTGLKKIAVKQNDICEEEEPMTPKGAIFRHPYKDSYILVIIGQGKQVDLPSLKATLQSNLVKHKRFSSIVVSILITLFCFYLVIFCFFFVDMVS